MLNLDSIKFTADTSELDLASKKIDALGTAISALSVDLAKMDKSSSAAAKAQAEANLANAKAEAIISKTSKATKDKADADDQSTKAVKENTSVLERQQSILEFMTQGFSKGQSSTLAYAKSTGILTSEMVELQSVLQSQRTLIGGDPFDKSLGALKSLQNEFKVLKEVQRLYNAEIPITQKQMENLALDKLRLIEAMKIEGKSMTDIKNAIRDLNADYIGLATNINRIAAADDALVKSNNDSAKAMGFLSREMERVDNVLTGFNNNLNVTTSNRLMKFREQLKLSGVDAVTAANMLKTYEDRLKTISATSANNSKNKREDELKYLARATSVQLGDIGISLAGGQNPLLVLIQQGDQLRGVLNQVGASGQEMQKALSMAFSQIVVGSKDVIVQLGSFVVQAFTDAGKAIADFGVRATGVGSKLELIRYELTLMKMAGSETANVLLKAFSYLPSVIGAGIGAMIALSASAVIALVQVTNANDDLSRSLIATGAQLGFTTEYAQGLATVLSGMGATRVDVLNTFSEIAKSGNIASESFLQVAEAAIAIERAGGPAIKETVKLFGDLKEKSVETLTKYAEQTGLVTVAQIAYVTELVRTGKEITATTEATDILTGAIKEQAKITYASLSSMGRLWVDLKNHMNNAWGSLQDFASGSGLLDLMAWAIGNVAAIFLRIGNYIATDIRLVSEFAAKSIALGKDALNLDSDFTEFKKISASIKEINDDREVANKDELDRLQQKGKYTIENMRKEAEAAAKQREANSLAASDFTKRAEVEKKIKEELEKLDAKNLTKQQFIAKAIESQNKAIGERNKLTAKNLADIEKIAAAEWDKSNKPKKQPKSDEMKSAEGTADWYRKSIERIDDLKNKTIGAVQELTKAQVLLMDLTDDEGFAKLNLRQKEYVLGRIEEVAELERSVALQKEQERLAKDLNKIKDDSENFSLKEQAAVEKIVSSSKLKLELLGKTADEQFEITEKYELQNKLNEVGLRFDQQRLKLKQEYEKIKPTSGEDRRMVDAAYAASVQEITRQEAETRDALMIESAGKFEANYIQKILNVGKTLSEAITTALFEGGQAGSKKLKDYIVGIFREKINISINSVVNAGLSSLFGGGSSGSNGNSGSSAGGLLSSLFGNSGGSGGGIMSTLGSLVSFTGTGFGAGLGATLGGVGTMGGLSAGASLIGTGTAAGATSGLGMIAGAAAPWVLGAMALKELTGYKLEDKGGGITATIGGANGLPSGQVGAYRLTQQTSGMGKTTMNGDWSVASQGVTDYIKNNVQAITEVNKAYGKSIGLTSDSIANFTKSIEINTTGMSAAQAQAAIDAELVKFKAEQSAATYGAALSGVALEGETTSQTLTRLGESITLTNASLATFGGAMYSVSVAGASAAAGLVAAFGSVQNMQQQLSQAVQNYATPGQQQDLAFAAGVTELNNAGISVTAESLRSMTREQVAAELLTYQRTASSTGATTADQTKFAAVVKVANKLSTYVPGFKSNEPPPPPVVEQSGSSGGGGGSDPAKSIASAWQSITDSIWGEVKRIRGLLQESSGNALEIAQQQFNEATNAARSGNQEAAKALPELSKTLLTISQGQASSLIELRRAQALTANSLEQTVTGLASTYGLTIPAFAGGGNYSGGMALVGEQGPELINFNQGGYVHNAGQTNSMLGGSDELISEIRRLNQKVDQLEAAAISTAISNSKIHKILERVTPNGTTVEVSGTVTAV